MHVPVSRRWLTLQVSGNAPRFGKYFGFRSPWVQPVCPAACQMRGPETEHGAVLQVGPPFALPNPGHRRLANKKRLEVATAGIRGSYDVLSRETGRCRDAHLYALAAVSYILDAQGSVGYIRYLEQGGSCRI
jgi:hypothetical protein